MWQTSMYMEIREGIPFTLAQGCTGVSAFLVESRSLDGRYLFDGGENPLH